MLSITTKIEDDRYEVKLSGEVDIYTVEDFKKSINDNMGRSAKDIVFDLCDLDYIDSTGLGALISFKSRYEGITIVVKNLKPNVKKLFDITGLSKIFVVK